MILDRLFHEEVLKFFQLRRILGGQIIGFAEIFGHVIEFPYVLRERWERHHQPRDGVPGAGNPAIVIDAAITKHLEVLSSVRLLGLGIVEGIDHRSSIERSLRPSHSRFWERQTGRFQNRRRNVGDNE